MGNDGQQLACPPTLAFFTSIVCKTLMSCLSPSKSKKKEVHRVLIYKWHGIYKTLSEICSRQQMQRRNLGLELDYKDFGDIIWRRTR